MAIPNHDYLCLYLVGGKPSCKVLTLLSLFPLNFNIRPSYSYCLFSRIVMRGVKIETVNVDIWFKKRMNIGNS